MQAQSAARQDAHRLARAFDMVPAKTWFRMAHENFSLSVDTYGLNLEQTIVLREEYMRVLLEECKRLTGF